MCHTLSRWLRRTQHFASSRIITIWTENRDENNWEKIDGLTENLTPNRHWLTPSRFSGGAAERAEPSFMFAFARASIERPQSVSTSLKDAYAVGTLIQDENIKWSLGCKAAE